MEGGFIANLLKGSVKSGLVTATPPELHATSIVAVSGRAGLHEVARLALSCFSFLPLHERII
jgi:hypothetical protein